MNDWEERLQQETEDLILKVNKLQDFMRTASFYKLGRTSKTLLYTQLKHMLGYLEVLGIRCEMFDIKLNIKE